MQPSTRNNGLISFTLADIVRVKPGVTPTTGWGQAGPASVGPVLELRDDDTYVVVDFPEQSGWVGKIREMEVVRRGMVAWYPHVALHKSMDKCAAARRGSYCRAQPRRCIERGFESRRYVDGAKITFLCLYSYIFMNNI